MDMSSLLMEAFGLLVTGMLFVYLFLVVLMGAIHLIRIWAYEPESTHASISTTNTSSSTEINPATVAAIACAVHQYRQNRAQGK